MQKKPVKHHFRNPVILDKTLSINAVGVREVMAPSLVDRPHGTGDWLVMFFHQKNQIMEKTAPENSIIIWTPGNYQKYGHLHRRWNHTWIHCDGSQMNIWVQQCRLPVNKIISGIPGEIVDSTLSNVLNEALHQDQYSRRLILNWLQNMFLQIGRIESPDQSTPSIDITIQNVKLEIEAHFDQQFQLSDLAAKAGLSVSHFSSCFRKHCGCSPIEYLIQQRMRQAEYLLYDHNLKIGDIAKRIGYDDLFHFSKMFKKHFGQSPANMRKLQSRT